MTIRIIRALRGQSVGIVALIVALGGTSYAALALPKNSVGTKQLRAGAVTSAKIKDKTIRLRDLTKGARVPGPQGPAGAAGAPGSAKAYAHIARDGTIVGGNKNVKGVTGRAPGTGTYCIAFADGIDVSTTVPIVTLDGSNDDTRIGRPGQLSYALALSDPGPNCAGVAVSTGFFKIGNLTGDGAQSADESFFIMLP